MATIEAEINILVVYMNVTPSSFQVSVINKDWVSPKVEAMMKKMSYEPEIVLEKKKNMILKLPNLEEQTSKQGLG